MSQGHSEDWAVIEALFDRASALPVEARADFLDRECPDEKIRCEVLSLLEYSSTNLDTLAGEIAAQTAEVVGEADPDERLIGARIGPYKVEAIVGHGGMGAVYRASRDDPEFRQQVAIKLVRAAMQSPDTLQRFKQERQILARLAHPNIARLLDGGSATDGIPYLVMEFIEGESITAYCRGQALSIEQRLRLFLQVCDGVQFAHTRQVVHRDLKPGNVLVTRDGTAKLLDFGIAKILDPQSNDAGATTVCMRALTPEYAAPEQVRGDPASKASDVYALGLILYEMLTGGKAQTFPDSSPGTVAQVVCHVEPPSPAALRPELAGDLDNIIRMAIRKEPQRRYASVADLAQDIRRHSEGRTVVARPDSLGYRASKFLRRNRANVAGALVTAAAFGAVFLAFRVFGTERLPRVSGVTQLTQSGHIGAFGLATDGSYVYCVQRSPGKDTLSRVPVSGGPPQPLHAEFDFPELLDISPDRTSLLISNGVGEDVPLWIVPTEGGQPRRVGDVVGHVATWRPDGKSIVFAQGYSLFGTGSDGSGTRKLMEFPGSGVVDIRWSPVPGVDVLRLSRTPYGRFEDSIWEARPDGTHLHPLFPGRGAVWGSAGTEDYGRWIAGGKYFVFRSVGGGIYRLFAMRENRRGLALPGAHPVSIHSSTSAIHLPTPALDDKRIYFIGGIERRQFVRFDRVRREFVPYLPGVAGRWATFSPDGRWLAYTVPPQETLWLSHTDGSDVRQLETAGLSVDAPSWSADGRFILFDGELRDQRAGIYRVPVAGGTPERLSSGNDIETHPSCSPDGKSMLFYRGGTPGEKGKGLYLMDWSTRKSSLLPGSEGMLYGFWSPNGRYIAARNEKELLLFDTRTQRWTVLGSSIGFGKPFWSSSGKYIFIQNQFEAEQPIFRVPVTGGAYERVMSSRQIPQSDITSYLMAGLTPDDAPVAAVVRKNEDIYALELDWP
jgi:Tol biopolymer transport system component